jgi:hypothetical protein
LIEFFQEINGIKYLLNNGAFNVLNVIKLSNGIWSKLKLISNSWWFNPYLEMQTNALTL